MAEREHFTNGRTWAFGTGFSLVGLSFGAQISGWGHWIMIGAGYGVGTLSMLLPSVLFTKSYFSSQSEHSTIAPKPTIGPFPADSSRLKIISAHYGVEGGPDDDVAEEYLRPRISGHALAGWVGADLFGPLDPAIGQHKRLKVHYSFEGRESIVERGENKLLVLPEDPLLKGRTISAPTGCTTPSELRGCIVELLGDFYALLLENGDDPCGLPEFSEFGFGSQVPEDAYVKTASAKRFNERLRAIEEGANRTGFWEKISISLIGKNERTSVLGEVRNAYEVRHQLDNLKDLLSAIDNKYRIGADR